VRELVPCPPAGHAARRGRRTVTTAALLVLAVGLGGPGCSGTFDREHAVDAALDRFGGRLTRPQAECYVDRVVDELGSATLDDEHPSPEKVPRLTRIRTDCAGVVSLGTSLPPSTQERTTGGSAPMTVGADPALDALHADCAGGSGQACDDLFDRAPLGSEYEDFALSCGGRTAALRCAEAYPGGRVG
jgi:hypothetical protein